jgi:chemotaxis protein MotB
MRIIKKHIIFLFIFMFLSNGCALVFRKGSRKDKKRIQALQTQLDKLRQSKQTLESKLSDELQSDKLSVSMQEKGLVITFLAEVLFDSGEAKLRDDSLPILNKVAGVLQEKFPSNKIGIEGHTDNQPIKYSSWESNWELSAHRALSVLEYLSSQGVDPQRLSATGYGKYHPVATNETDEGRQLNRRVEIVIVPRAITRAKQEPSAGSEEVYEYEEELK